MLTNDIQIVRSADQAWEPLVKNTVSSKAVTTAAGPIMTAVQLLRPRVEPRLRGFVNWTTVLARSREAVTRALDEDPTWRTTRATGVVVGRPRPDHVGPG